MGYYNDSYRDYETVAERVAKAKRQLEKLKKTNPDICPIVIEGRTIAKSWWGKAWNKNLETYADHANRISRGRSYVKNGLVLDLTIEEGTVCAMVSGTKSKPYSVTVKIEPLQTKKLDSIVKLCNRRISSLDELLAGRFPKELEELFTKSGQGLFPTRKEISFYCSCPDSAYMCKHVSAVLYAIGAKFDTDPALFFKLRGIEFSLLLAKAVEEKAGSMLKNAEKKSGRALADDEVSDLFGI